MNVANVPISIVSLASCGTDDADKMLPAVSTLVAHIEAQSNKYKDDFKGRFAASMSQTRADKQEKSWRLKAIYESLWKFAEMQNINRMPLDLMQAVLLHQKPLPNSPKVEDANDETLGGVYVPFIRGLFIPTNQENSKSGIHAMAHELSHAAAIDLDIDIDNTDPMSYSFGEIVAETSSYLFMDYLGVDNGAQAARYIDLYGPPSKQGIKWDFHAFIEAMAGGVIVAAKMIDAYSTND
jgi:hypothetical protein